MKYLAILLVIGMASAGLRYNSYTNSYENAPSNYQMKYNSYNNSYQYAAPNAPMRYNSYNNTYYYDNYDTGMKTRRLSR